tara:strand:+ start:124948 stop:126327 length:1380 start_codon:yes stop_codon:yes gene_type:complete
MSKLDFEKYYFIPFQKVDSTPCLINKKYTDLLFEECAYLESLRETQKELEVSPLFFLKTHHHKNKIKCKDLSNLGLRTTHSSKSVLNAEDYNQLYKDSYITIQSEKFNHFSTLYSGSTRHGLINQVQLKGVGRSLNLNYDFEHSSGSITLQDCLKSISNEEIIYNRTKQLSTTNIGVFKYTDTNSYFLAREYNPTRLACIFQEYISENEINVIKSRLIENGLSLEYQKYIQEFMERIIKLYTNGINLHSPSLDNLVLDAKWIDTESFSISTKRKQPPAHITLAIPGEVKVNDFENFANIKAIYFYNSWLHDLRHIYQLTSETFLKTLDKQFTNIDTDLHFKSLIQDTSLHLEPFYIKTLKARSEKELKYYKKDLLKEMSLLETKELEAFKNYHIRGCFYDRFYDLTLVHLIEKDSDILNVSNVCNKIKMSIEHKKEQSITESEKIYDLFKQLIQEIDSI